MANPLACASAELAVDSLLRTACDELGSLDVAFNASSTYSLVVGGALDSASVQATGISAGGVRATRLRIDAEDVAFVPLADPLALLTGGASFPGSAAELSKRLPNLRAPTPIRFDLRLSQEDLNESPVLFGALQELLRELIRSGVSAAIGEVLPRDSQALTINLNRVEALQGGRIILQADAESIQRDGTKLALQGMRVRTFVRVNQLDGLVMLDSPELISSFEGFGAKVEVGLPFLRGAGIPLPDFLSFSSLVVDNGGIDARGTVTISPVDYEDLGRLAAELQRDLQSTPQAVSAGEAASAPAPNFASNSASDSASDMPPDEPLARLPPR